MPHFTRLLESFLALLFPERCAGCGKSGELLCVACCSKLAPYPGIVRPITGLNSVAVAFLFQSPLREAIHALKYRRRRRVAQPLGQLLGALAADHAPRVDAIIPVPMHATRLAERSFNQAELIARATAIDAGITCCTNGMIRVRATDQQIHLNAHQRKENMHGAFAWHATTPPPARVLLLDDVFTTGATMSACALALRDAGCREVYGIALARSRPDRA